MARLHVLGPHHGPGERKSAERLGRPIVAGEGSWYVNGERRHNPVNQAALAARLAALRRKL